MRADGVVDAAFGAVTLHCVHLIFRFEQRPRNTTGSMTQDLTDELACG